MIYLVSRHPGAIDWLHSRLGRACVQLSHLASLDGLGPGDTVVGTLPVQLIAQLGERGVRYLHLQISLPPALRGQELSAAQLTALGASLVEYVAYTPCDDAWVLHEAELREE